MVVTDGINMYESTDGGYWKRKRQVTPRPQHVCALPDVPDGVALNSLWVCSRCDVEWTLCWINDGSQYPGVRAAANTPHRFASDGSLWIAFGRSNRKLLKRRDVCHD